MPTLDPQDLQIAILTGTTSGTANTTTTHAHGGGIVPRFYTLLSRGNGLLYEAAAPDQTNISVRSPATSIPFTAIVWF